MISDRARLSPLDIPTFKTTHLALLAASALVNVYMLVVRDLVMGIGELAHIHDSFTSTVRVSPSRGQVVEGQGVRALRATTKGVGRHHRHSGLAYEVGRLGARLIGPFFGRHGHISENLENASLYLRMNEKKLCIPR